MKWICEKCKAINAALAFKCHNCGLERPEDNGPHRIVGAHPSLGAAYDADAIRPQSGLSPYGRLLISSLDLKFIRETTPPIIPNDPDLSDFYSAYETAFHASDLDPVSFGTHTKYFLWGLLLMLLLVLK